MELWQRIRDDLRQCLDLLLPPACLLCGRRLPPGAADTALCPTCLAAMPQPTAGRCPVCAIAFRTLTTSTHHCETCLRQPPPFTRVHAVGPYAGTLLEAIQHFKYRGQLPLARPLGILLAEAVRSAREQPPDLIVPVPLHKNRLQTRGYNQSLQLARRAGRCLGVPVAPRLLCRVRDTASQQGLDALARKSNLKGAFAVSARVPLAARRVLLVDDVMTTGATVRECATVLRVAGAASVEVAVVGRA